jgi:hypothetical protein
VNNCLMWKLQVEQTIQKCKSNLYLLYGLNNFSIYIPGNFFTMPFTLSHTDYCYSILGKCSNELLEIMLRFHKRAATDRKHHFFYSGT